MRPEQFAYFRTQATSFIAVTVQTIFVLKTVSFLKALIFQCCFSVNCYLQYKKMYRKSLVIYWTTFEGWIQIRLILLTAQYPEITSNRDPVDLGP